MKLFLLLLAALFCSCNPGMGPVAPKTKVERQMIGLLEKFDRWDYNGDGYLNVREVGQGIDTLRGKPQQVTYTAAEVIDFYDTNHDKKVSLKEAQDAYQRSDEAETQLQP